MKKLVANSLIVFLFSVTAFVSSAQNRVEIIDTIYSEILKENRALLISLPAGYDADSTEKYEVIYILDGEWNAGVFSFIYGFAMGDKFVPPAILVSLPNTYIEEQNMRDRDFLPLEMKDNERAGGANEFIECLRKEVLPHIDDRYATNNVNSLYGHSYGGLFSMYVLLSNPDLFANYYCTDPPLGWKNGYLKKLAEESFAKASQEEKILWIAGTSNNSSVKNMSKFRYADKE